MSIDMEQFKSTFIEESLEGLQTMESVLLEMHPGETESDAIDNIFRAAHSIKGGSATFGFDDIANFTHVVETLLDEIRNGQREVTQESIRLFLSSVDCIRDMLTPGSGEAGLDKSHIDQVKSELDNLLHSADVGAEVAEQGNNAIAVEDATSSGWEIFFQPFPSMLRTGNDVVRMFRELNELGEMSAVADLSNLPPLANIDPEEACLSWNISILGNVTREQVDEVFAWVEGDCVLDIKAISKSADDSGSNNQQLSNDTEPFTDQVHDSTLKEVPAIDDKRSGDDRRQSDERRKSEGNRKTVPEMASIRVDIDKVDTLINMVGELVITQSMLGQLGENFDMDKVERLQDGLSELERNTRELQETVMRIRMLPISFAFNRFPRMVHDLSAKLGKQIELKMSGEQTELDKTVMEKIGDPLVHLVRNAIDHGIESPEQRLAAGKSETGVVHLNAYHQGGNIMIEIHDDGAGLNHDRIRKKAVERGLINPNDDIPEENIYDLLFQPGFSTAEEVSDVSGRGVGMDVVKRNIQALGGGIDVKSTIGEGSTFTIRLPLTLAILDGQLVRVGKNIYIIPLISIVESILVDKNNVNNIAGAAELYQLRSDYLPVIRLYETFGVEPDTQSLDDRLLVVVEGDGKKGGLLVDELLGQQQVVIKSLETNFRRVDGVSGATILGDGTVALIVDVAGAIRLSTNPGEKFVAA
jgi:two-component system chemotaxis sensor kinase CheA